MLGAIIGGMDEDFTGDCMMTFAVAKAIMESEKIIEPLGDDRFNHDYHKLLSELTGKYMQELGRQNTDAQSIGKDETMCIRMSHICPAGYGARTESEAMRLSRSITFATHGREEKIEGAETVAVAIYMARQGFLKSEIRERLCKGETGQGTVGQAMACFLGSKSFEDAISTARSLGGDRGEVAAITGAVAEAYYGVPDDIRDKMLANLDEGLRSLYDEWEVFIGKDDACFKALTKYIGKLSPTRSTGWSYLNTPCYEKWFPEFCEDFRQFTETNYPQYCAEYGFFDYTAILRTTDRDENAVRNGHVDHLDALAVLAILQRELISGDRWNYDPLDSFKEEKFIDWLKRLKDLDRQATPKKLSEVYFQIGGYEGYNNYHFLITDSRAFLFSGRHFPNVRALKRYAVRETEQLLSTWDNIHTEYWRTEYSQEGNMMILDGTQWSLFVRYEGSRGILYTGDNTYPANWNELLALFAIDDEDDDEDEVRKPGEIIYCSVSFSEDGRTYYYQTEDEAIEVGDHVMVPVGSDHVERIAVVEEIEYFEPAEVPFPIEKTKFIIGKRSDQKDELFPFDKLVLCDGETSRIQVKVWAEVTEGCLKITGQDLGEAAEELYGENAYEYFYDFDRENTGRLFTLMSQEAPHVKEAFLQKFSGMDGCRSLREYCDAHGIVYSFFRY